MIPKNRELYNQFGASDEGRITRSALLLRAYEGYRESRFQRVTSTVPSDVFRSEILRALRI